MNVDDRRIWVPVCGSCVGDHCNIVDDKMVREGYFVTRGIT